LENDYEHIDILIAKAALGEASPEEIVELYDWENLSEENRLYVAEGSKVFEHIAQVDVDTDAAWNKLKQRIDEDEKPVIPITRQRRNLVPYWAAAASVAILVALTFYFVNNGNGVTNTSTWAAKNEIVKDTMPDGSTFELAEGSNIEYFETPKGREVKLKGSAYFTIKHDDKKPFVIEANNVFIKDIGTEFTVTAMPESKVTEVYVTGGVVDFYTKKDKGITLTAGQKGTYNSVTKIFTKIDSASTTNTQLSKQFNFSATKLVDVVAQLNAVYNSNVVIESEAIKNCSITVKFDNKDLDFIIDIITQTLNIKATKTDSKIILSGAGC